MSKSDIESVLDAATATLISALHRHDEPYAKLDDLMCVIEALCPVWPQRPATTKLEVAIL